MKVLVLDIETTGFSVVSDSIVEIGLVLVDTETKEIKKVFDKVVREYNFSYSRHKDSWVFKNSNLTLRQVLSARPLESYRTEIQKLLNLYDVTAYNKTFDLRFMKSRNFTFKDTKCLMKACSPYSNSKNDKGNKKKASVQEIYNQFFPEETYIEEHRGGDDAIHEAKILLKLCELKEKTKKNRKTLG